MGRLAEKLGVENILCNCPVTSIDQAREPNFPSSELTRETSVRQSDRNSSGIGRNVHNPIRNTCGTAARDQYIDPHPALPLTPNCLIVKIEMDPALPSSQRFLFNHMPVGHLIKCILTYETAFWKDDGYSGEIISSSSTTHSVGDRQGEPIRDSSPVSCVWDATTADGLPALVVLQGGKHSIMWSDEKVKKQ